jgi:hypothetical protein
MRTPRKSRFAALFIAALILAGVLATSPWAFHIGGRWTPLLTWCGSGTLYTKGGIGYPLFVFFYPSSHFSRLRSNGLRPTGGVQGSACLCTSPGVNQYLKLSGTIYGGWRSTEGSVIAFRLLEPTVVDVGQQRAGYFDLIGGSQGQSLVMTDRGAWSSPFRSGLRIEHASVTLHWDPFLTCQAACATVAGYPLHRRS